MKYSDKLFLLSIIFFTEFLSKYAVLWLAVVSLAAGFVAIKYLDK